MASMRPPEFTGGNASSTAARIVRLDHASMRPPEFTGGNLVVLVAIVGTALVLQ